MQFSESVCLADVLPRSGRDTMFEPGRIIDCELHRQRLPPHLFFYFVTEALRSRRQSILKRVKHGSVVAAAQSMLQKEAYGSGNKLQVNER